MENGRTLDVMVVPVGGLPYRKTLEADVNGSFLHGLQACVGGPIEPAGYLFEDAPAVYVNAEGLLGASLETANRAIYATGRMAELGYLSQMDYSHVVEEGELYSIVFGDMVCVGFDPETGEDRDITDAETERVMERFGSDESVMSGGLELVRTMLRSRAAG